MEETLKEIGDNVQNDTSHSWLGRRPRAYVYICKCIFFLR